MRIDVANASARQLMAFDELHHFAMRRGDGFREVAQIAQHLGALRQAAKRDLANHEWMRERFVSVEQHHQLGIGGAEVVDPNRGVDQDHRSAGPAARRGLGFRIAPAQPREPTRALTLDQRLKRLAHERGFLADAGEGFGFSQEIVIESERGPHGTEYDIK